MNDTEVKRGIEALEKVGRVLGALYASHLGNMEQGLKAQRLSRCGFSNIEIADLLGTTPNTVNVALHKARKGQSKKSKKK
jgi:hypothetical protein